MKIRKQTTEHGHSDPFHPETSDPSFGLAFDMDTKTMRRLLGDSYPNGYLKIQKVLGRHGFFRLQGSMYAATASREEALVAAAALRDELEWFPVSVKCFVLFPLDDHIDLMPAIAGDLALAA